jgi:hypothetical protein
MNRCIYTGKSEKEATFTQREHVIPKAIGGIYTLPVGYVSDEINHLFSCWEEQFVHQFPFITIPRSLFGPDGRKKHNHAANVTFMKSIKDGSMQLGYLRLGIPYTLNQAVFTLNINSIPDKLVEFKFEVKDKYGENRDKYNLENCSLKFLNDLKAADDKYKLIYDDSDVIKNKIFVGVKKRKIFIGLSKNTEYGDVHELIGKLLRLLKSITKEDFLRKCRDNDVHYSIHYVKVKQNFYFRLGLIYKVYAKIAFNVLAKLEGQEFVLRRCFDPLRKAIIGNNMKEIFNFCSLGKVNEDPKINKSYHLLKIGNNSHLINFLRENNQLFAMIQLYGGHVPAFVSMCRDDENISDFDTFTYPQGYLCDWENHDEDVFAQLIIERMKKLGALDDTPVLQHVSE